MRDSQGSHDITGTSTNVLATIYAHTEFSHASFHEGMLFDYLSPTTHPQPDELCCFEKGWSGRESSLARRMCKSGVLEKACESGRKVLE